MVRVVRVLPSYMTECSGEGERAGGRVPVVNPEDIHIIVSGSIPGYSFGMSYFRTAHKTKLIKKAAPKPNQGGKGDQT